MDRAAARRRRSGAVLTAVAAIALAGCPTPGGPTSPDPVRFVLEGGQGPCRIVFGPVAPDRSLRLEEVGALDTPDGPTLVARGPVGDGRDVPDLEIDGIDVHLSASADTVQAVWQLPPTEIWVSTRSLAEDELRELLPTLVMTADASQLARTLVDRIPGAELRSAGPAPGYDVGLTYDDGTLAIAGRGVADDRLDAFLAVVGERLGVGDVALRAEDATVIVDAGRERASVSASTFVGLVEALMADEVPTVAVGDGSTATIPSSCRQLPDAPPAASATIRDASIAESDVGDLLRVTFDGLPADGADPQTVHVTIGGVELVAEHTGDDTVLFPATLTHAEARLLAERLTP